MLYLFNSDNQSQKKTFQFLRQRIDPKTSCMSAQCITHCSNMSFCQLFSHLLLFVNSNIVILLYSFQTAIESQKKTIPFLRPRIDPKTSCSNAQCITHSSNMSFSKLFSHFAFVLSMQMLSYFCIITRQPLFSFSVHFMGFKHIFGCVKLFQRLIPNDQPLE